jgi:hypothetical protein
MGPIYMWCTNKTNLVLINCVSKTIIISPSDPSAFVHEYIQKSRNINRNIKRQPDLL